MLCFFYHVIVLLTNCIFSIVLSRYRDLRSILGGFFTDRNIAILVAEMILSSVYFGAALNDKGIFAFVKPWIAMKEENMNSIA